MAIKGLEQAVENLSRISKTAVPGAAAMAINRVASSAISQSASQVARETKVRRKLVKERARLKRATVKNPDIGGAAYRSFPACSGAGFRAGCVDGVPDLSGDERYPGTVRFDHQYGGQRL